MLVALSTADGVRLALVRRSARTTLDEPACFDLLRRALGSEAGDMCTRVPRRLVRSALVRAVRAARRAASGRAPPPVSSRAGRRGPRPARDAALLLLRVVPRIDTDPALCRRADRCLRMLDTGVPAGIEHALAALLEEQRSPDAAAWSSDEVGRLLASIETALWPFAGRSAAARGGSGGANPVGPDAGARAAPDGDAHEPVRARTARPLAMLVVLP